MGVGGFIHVKYSGGVDGWPDSPGGRVTHETRYIPILFCRKDIALWIFLIFSMP
jgi:hypothetical protein